MHKSCEFEGGSAIKMRGKIFLYNRNVHISQRT